MSKPRPHVLSMVLAGLLACAARGAGDETGVGPRIHSPEPEASLGRLFQGETATHTFRVENTGDADLEIIHLRPNCGCAIARIFTAEPRVEVPIDPRRLVGEKPLVVLAPGASADILVEYDATGQPPRPLRKHVLVQSNDTRQPGFRLTFDVDIQEAVVVEPRPLRFDDVTVGFPATREVMVRPARGIELALTGVDNTDELVAAQVEAIEGEDGRAWKVTVTLTDQLPLGDFSRTLAIRVDHPRLDPLKLPIFARVVGVVRFDTRNPFNSEVLNFGAVAGGRSHTRAIDIVNHDPAVPYRVTAVEVEGEHAQGIIARPHEVEAGRHYRVFVIVPEDFRKPFFKGTVRIRAEHPTLAEKAIPFSGMLGKAGR